MGMISLAAPIALMQLGLMAYGVVDTLFMGRLGAESVAGVGLGEVVDAEALSASRPHLRDRVSRHVRLALETAVHRPPPSLSSPGSALPPR